MSLFAKYTKFGNGAPTTTTTATSSYFNENNITHRKKLSAVSRSMTGDDAVVTASPRNCYQRSTVSPLRTRTASMDESDGARLSQIRRIDDNDEPHEALEALPTSSTGAKKTRPSTSSLTSMFRNRAGSPMDKFRKIISRSSSSKAALQKSESEFREIEKSLNEEIDRLKDELKFTRVQLNKANTLIEKSQKIVKSEECQVNIVKDSNEVGTMTDETAECEIRKTDKENVNPSKTPEIICLDEENNVKAELKQALMKLEEERREHKAVYRDFLTVVRLAERQREDAESRLEAIMRSSGDDEDWSVLMAQHRHTLRRNALLMWAQKKLAPYEQHDFPDDDPLFGDCIEKCRRAFDKLNIKFDIDLNESSVPNWRDVMDSVFLIYKKGVLKRE
ncbi:unnamed protein product [Caenorhabditis bovis]|uniref:Calponin-homology (CH) domain-containing protein n=1 Tax=Caenorhabditis bovis TaxID=2654633 RepID=A0A8S1ETY7_9PELO|nr:unnamed protein product [Caenorhabditis bovis]